MWYWVLGRLRRGQLPRGQLTPDKSPGGQVPLRISPPEDNSPGGHLPRRQLPREDNSPEDNSPERTTPPDDNSPGRTTPPGGQFPLVQLPRRTIPPGYTTPPLEVRGDFAGFWRNLDNTKVIFTSGSRWILQKKNKKFPFRMLVCLSVIFVYKLSV